MRLASQEGFDKAGSRDLIDLLCDYCNGVFQKPKNDVLSKLKKRKRGSKRYCSHVCADKGHRRPDRKCKNCGGYTRTSFCSHSCSATFNNPLKASRKRSCPECGALHLNLKFCSRQCDQRSREKAFIAEWKAGRYSGMAPHGAICEQVRRYIFCKYGVKCARCGWCEVNPANGKIPVQIEHIDGDFRNCAEENLIVLCPNCHSLTPTYMTLNRGRGRDVNGVRRRKFALVG
jgi:hypothetical protein